MPDACDSVLVASIFFPRRADRVVRWMKTLVMPLARPGCRSLPNPGLFEHRDSGTPEVQTSGRLDQGSGNREATRGEARRGKSQDRAYPAVLNWEFTEFRFSQRLGSAMWLLPFYPRRLKACEMGGKAGEKKVKRE